MSLNKRSTVPSFDTVDQFKDALKLKQAFKPVDLYPRDSSNRLYEIESHIADISGYCPHETIVYGSGMTAITNALDIALVLSDNDMPVIAAGYQFFTQTARYLDTNLAKKSVKIVRFDSGSRKSVESVIEQHQPDIILCETIANGPDMPVLDIRHLQTKLKKQKKKPMVILDNTLPLSSGLSLTDVLNENNNTVVVESGCKSFMFNEETLGIAYCKSDDIVRALRTLRRANGTMPGVGSLQRIQSLLPATSKEFNERNIKIFAKAKELAASLKSAEQMGGQFTVAHPSLPGHANNMLAKNLVHGSSPVVFLRVTSNAADQFDLVRQLGEDPEVKKHADIGQSFCFDRARIFPDETAKVVRIAAGANTDTDSLGRALIEAAIKT